MKIQKKNSDESNLNLQPINNNTCEINVNTEIVFSLVFRSHVEKKHKKKLYQK